MTNCDKRLDDLMARLRELKEGVVGYVFIGAEGLGYFDALEALQSRLEAVEKDTARLDWLIHTIHRDTMERYLGRPCNTTDDVRPAIDAAIAQEQKRE